MKRIKTDSELTDPLFPDHCSHALSIAVAVQSLMLWTKFTYFLRAYSFSSTVDTIVYVVRQCS